MKFVFIGVLLALAQYGYAAKVCNQDVADSADLIVTCNSNKRVLYPNYAEMSTFYKCYDDKPLVERCPANQYFCYYQQTCVDCSKFLTPPPCNFFTERMNLKCSSKQTTKPPATTKAPGSTDTTASTSTAAVPTAKTTRPPVPTPPSQKVTTARIPMPPMVVTPVPGIPTPPNENLTPPSIPAAPPMVTIIPSP